MDQIALDVAHLFAGGLVLVSFMLLYQDRMTGLVNIFALHALVVSLSVLLLGLLMMVSRRNAVGQVIGFMSLENGLILAATGARGMPLVVEISVAFSILIAIIVIGIFLLRIRERFETVDVHLLHEHRGEQP